jgi:hypothetical protein
MDATKLTAFVSLMIGLSVATERLVEIIKGLFETLNCERPDPVAEGRRKSSLQIIAVLAGIATAWAASPYIPVELARPTESWHVIGLGLLASGGSGFWNSIATYVLRLKDLKEAQAKAMKTP